MFVCGPLTGEKPLVAGANAICGGQDFVAKVKEA